MTTYDAIVLGCGGIGSAALAHLAKRGLRVLGIDRYYPPHDRGSSHGATRIIRQAYFEHTDYVPLVQRAFDLWTQLEERTGRSLYQQTGLLQVGPADGHILPAVKASAQAHRLALDELTARDVEARWPGFRLPTDLAALLERRAGTLFVEECVQAHMDYALRLGAELHANETVQRWATSGDNVVVDTDRGSYEAARLVITAGPWAASLLADLGLSLTVLRKTMYWWPADDAYTAARGFPAYLFELPFGGPPDGTGAPIGYPATSGTQNAEGAGGQATSGTQRFGPSKEGTAGQVPRPARDFSTSRGTQKAEGTGGQATSGTPTAASRMMTVTNAIFYGFPRFDARGVKVAEHTGGDIVADPASLNRELDAADRDRVAGFVREHLPGLGSPLLASAVCMYTMSADGNFIVDRHPEHPQVVFAAGLSGHGFKFAPVLGQALCELAIDGRTELPIGFLSLDRPGLRRAV